MSATLLARAAHNRLLQKAHRHGEKGRYAQAEALYRRYLEHCPTDPQVCFNLGVLTQRKAKDMLPDPLNKVLMDTLYEASEWYQKCICAPECDPITKSNALNNLGLIAGKMNRPDKAGISFGFALKINPENNAARINYADVLRFDGKYEEADREFGEVLRQDPSSDAAKFSAGMIALLLGDLKRGFELYEARFGCDSFPTREFKTDKPKWTGEDLAGKTICIAEEQGFGDQLMFCRYFPLLKQRGATVWLRGNALYRNISSGMDGLDRFFSLDEELPEFDYYCHTLSLPQRFGTTLETVPAEAPYIRNNGWPEYQIGTATNKKRVGLCWAGSPRHGKDAWRSLPPESFQPLIDAHPEIQFYSLQCGPRAHEVERLKKVIDLAPTITDWTDTAQALQQLDLLVSVDTALVHLSGALDRPAWMLTPHSPDWRWLLSGGTSPWYPKLKLFRQPKQDDWETPLRQIQEAL